MKRPAFAPGVIEHHKRRHIRNLARWIFRAFGLLLLAAVLGAGVTMLQWGGV